MGRKLKNPIVRIQTKNEAVELIDKLEMSKSGHPEKVKIELQIKKLKERFHIESI